MGLINSAINQIGREMGRDIYKGLTKTNNSNTSYSDLSSLENNIKSFELSGYDKVTVRKLTNLVERVCAESDGRSFDYADLYTSMVGKIELAMENIDQEFHDELNKLVSKLYNDFEVSKKTHKEWVAQAIQSYNTQIEVYGKKKNLVLYLIKRVWVVIHFVVLCFLFYQAGFTFDGSFTTDPNTNHSMNLYGIWTVLYFFVFFGISFLVGFSCWRDDMKELTKKQKTRDILVEYEKNITK